MKTILVIDIEEICEILSEEIAELGDFTVIAKCSVQAAEAYLAGNQVDFVICDKHMFDIDLAGTKHIWYTANCLLSENDMLYKPTETSVILAHLLKSA